MASNHRNHKVTKTMRILSCNMLNLFPNDTRPLDPATQNESTAIIRPKQKRHHNTPMSADGAECRQQCTLTRHPKHHAICFEKPEATTIPTRSGLLSLQGKKKQRCRALSRTGEPHEAYHAQRETNESSNIDTRDLMRATCS